MAEAMQQGADCVVTIGGIQSNHCRATGECRFHFQLNGVNMLPQLPWHGRLQGAASIVISISNHLSQRVSVMLLQFSWSHLVIFIFVVKN